MSGSPSPERPDGPGVTADPEPIPPQEEKGGLSFPSALTVLAIILVVVWVAAFVMPSGSYRYDADGQPIPGSYIEIPKCERGVETEATPVRSIDRSPDGEPCIDKSVLNALFSRAGGEPVNLP